MTSGLSHYALVAEFPNQRVEVNRHQTPCLPGRFDFMIAIVYSNLVGQVAVTHPWRSGTVRHASGCFEMERVESDLSRRSRSRTVGLRR